jgi:hypothetical protein
MPSAGVTSSCRTPRISCRAGSLDGPGVLPRKPSFAPACAEAGRVRRFGRPNPSPKNRTRKFPRIRLKPLRTPFAGCGFYNHQALTVNSPVTVRVQQDQIVDRITAAVTTPQKMVDVPAFFQRQRFMTGQTFPALRKSKVSGAP